MRIRSLLAIILVLTLLVPVPGQNSSTAQQGRTAEDEDVVRITTNLIQVDAVVTDKNGKPVTDLRADEFEIQENGEKQTITNFSYVPVAPLAPETQTPADAGDSHPADKNAPPPPPTRLRPEEAHRTIALVVDDLGLSFQSVAYVRRALKKFVDDEMQPNDLVSIVRTSTIVGALQMFTSDKVQLLAAIERIRWNPLGRGGISPFAPIEGEDISSETSAEVPGASDQASAGLDEFSDELFTIGTLGTIEYLVRGLKDIPGRKSLMLFSDGIRILNSEGQSDRILDALQHLTDLANRASVVFYTLDARGLPSLELSAADNSRGLQGSSVGGNQRRGGLSGSKGGAGGMVNNKLEARLLQRRMNFFETQQGMNYLADHTSGLTFRNNNDLTAGIKKMLEDQKGYYLIAYRPNDETFDPKRARFNKLTIKVKRSGLKVRYRSGFFGVADEETTPRAPATRAQQLARAIVTPSLSNGIDVRLTSLFANDAAAGSFMRSLLHVDADKLTFTEEPDGWRKVVFDVMAVTFGEGGAIIDEVSRTENVRVRGETHRLIMQNGFDYIITVPIRSPGAYQLRAALRDTVTERIGSASQYIEVPDLKNDRIALSGIVVNGFDPAKLKASVNSVNTDAGKPQPEPQTGPGVRRLRRGLVMEFGYVIYNAQLSKATQRPQLATQIRLFRDGRQVFAGNVLPFDPGAQIDLKRLNAGGRLQLGTDMPVGDYVLQIVVMDSLAKEKLRTATQWIDFQISDK